MKISKITITALLLFVFAASRPAHAKDFWEITGENLYYHFTARQAPTIQKLDLTSDDVWAMSGKSLGSAFSDRFSKTTKNRKNFPTQCLTSKFAEACYVQTVLDRVFDEVKLVNGPRFGLDFYRRAKKFYDFTNDRNEDLDEKLDRARLVPPWKKFNPRLLFDVKDLNVYFSTPFYSYFGVYVEPRVDLGDQASIMFLRKNFSVNVDPNDVTVEYRWARNSWRKKHHKIFIKKDKGVFFESVLKIW